jgi:hypothetical protein
MRILNQLLGGNKTIKFDEIMVGENYKISQLIVDPNKQTAAVEFTAISEMQEAVDLTATFFDESGNRVGIASALISKALATGQTTSIVMQFVESNGLGKIRQVRVEVTPLTPLMLMERAADYVKKTE